MEIRLAHVGINPESAGEIQAMRDFLCLGLGLPETGGTPSAWFAADGKIEILKERGLGAKGHLAFYTSDLPETIAMLERQGYGFDLSTAKYEQDGTMRLIYLDREINGFAVHFTTRG